MWVMEGEKNGENGDMISLGRWRAPHLSVQAKLYGAKSFTSRTHWVSHFYFLIENPKDLLEKRLYCELGNCMRMGKPWPLWPWVSVK